MEPHCDSLPSCDRNLSCEGGLSCDSRLSCESLLSVKLPPLDPDPLERSHSAGSAYFDAYSPVMESPTISGSPDINYCHVGESDIKFCHVGESEEHHPPLPSVLDLPGVDAPCTATISQLTFSTLADCQTAHPTLPPTKQPAIVKSNSFDSDDDLFECGICTEDLKVPKALPCLHNFCMECLHKYFSANNLTDEKTFMCPTCRSQAMIPKGGADGFPTNFHILNLRKKRKDLDLGRTIKEAVQYLECRAEEIVDELSERKRQVLIEISQRRSEMISRIENISEHLLEAIEEQYTNDSTKSVNTIDEVKTTLSDLQRQLQTTNIDSKTTNTDSKTTNTDSKTTNTDIKTTETKTPEAIRLNALTRLRRQAEIITNVNNELEELKSDADHALSLILSSHTAFCPGSVTRHELTQSFGRLVLLSGGKTLEQYRREERRDEGFSPLHVTSWSQSWWVLVFAVLPAIICALIVKVIMTLVDRLLG